DQAEGSEQELAPGRGPDPGDPVEDLQRRRAEDIGAFLGLEPLQHRLHAAYRIGNPQAVRRPRTMSLDEPPLAPWQRGDRDVEDDLGVLGADDEAVAIGGAHDQAPPARSTRMDWDTSRR